MAVVLVDMWVRSLHGLQLNSCSQDFSVLLLEAVQVVFMWHLTHFGGDGACGGHRSLG